MKHNNKVHYIQIDQNSLLSSLSVDVSTLSSKVKPKLTAINTRRQVSAHYDNMNHFFTWALQWEPIVIPYRAVLLIGITLFNKPNKNNMQVLNRIVCPPVASSHLRVCIKSPEQSPCNSQELC